MPSSRQDHDIEAALRHCEAEQVHTPGHIQPHGTLIAVDNDTLEIRHVSENTIDFLGVHHRHLLGKRLNQVFAPKTRHEMANGIILDNTAQPSLDLGAADLGAISALMTAARSGPLTLFEFEATVSGRDRSFQSFKDFEQLIAQVRLATSPLDLCETTVESLRRLTGYDRVLVYEFDSEHNGTVVSEAANPEHAMFRSLTFPAWDVPAQARALMREVPLRYIADVEAPPSMLHAADAQAPALDLTHAHLRSVSPVHLQYLRNMGVRASCSLNIVVDGRLWGLISFHHGWPRYPGQRMRQLCRSFAAFFAQRLHQFELQRNMDRLQSASALCRRLVQRHALRMSEDTFAERLLEDLCDAVRASGAVLMTHAGTVVVGDAPQIDAIVQAMDNGHIPTGETRSASLVHDHPDLAQMIGPDYAGMLALCAPDAASCLLFRRSQTKIVAWAGAPEKTIEAKDGTPQLVPRGSFEPYYQKVENTSEDWSATDCAIFKDLMPLLRMQAQLVRNA